MAIPSTFSKKVADDQLAERCRAQHELIQKQTEVIAKGQRLIQELQEHDEMREARFLELKAQVRARSQERDRQIDGLVISKDENMARLEAVIQEIYNHPEADLQRRYAEVVAERDQLMAQLEDAQRERRAALQVRDALRAQLQAHCSSPPSDEAENTLPLLQAHRVTTVLEQAGEVCTLVRITADRDEAAALDHDAEAPAVRRRLAEALATMQAYGEAKAQARAEGRPAGATLASLRSYVESGNGWLGAHHVAPAEGQGASTNRQMRQVRTFHLPEELGGGRAVMNEHIRIGSGRGKAARLHYLDDTDQSGLLVIGYVGKHLKNLSTN
ncbi:hypothetical protein OH738_40945 (plasmid) [Streptomyces hirsutus]|uniref:hypothetical protein n=1 Tax=Streptomyces hirsutus TaxID=35620 RepID=UPI002F908E7F|nr:hypothetical protein OH738_40945 [Streptomyces hirsutus]